MAQAPLEPVVDDLWGGPSLAYHVQPHFTRDGQTALAAIQRLAVSCWPRPLRVPPPHALHVTIYALVPVRGAFDKEAYWGEIRDRATDLVRTATAAAVPFALRFTGIRVRHDSIIAVAEDPSGLIARLRDAIVERLPPPPGLSPLRYDLVHCTLARYADTAPLPRALIEEVESRPVDVPAPVERIRIVRETAYPCLARDEIVGAPLAGRRA